MSPRASLAQCFDADSGALLLWYSYEINLVAVELAWLGYASAPDVYGNCVLRVMT